ncbi:hypothetical protein F4604DRAFT_1884396 [Suillus subluteus]|nr:hypothetical protein F4604DRAFT_1884396 [Suillus subluteus]
MNLLCNPMGKSLSFRPVDWLVERNNLYTKVIFAGTGPNRTIEHIIKQSPLIEVYCNCHRLASCIKEKHSHTFKPGRSALCSIPGQVTVGMSLMQERKVSMTDEAEMDNIDPEDLID